MYHLKNKHNIKRANSISITHYSKLKELFEKKHWVIDEDHDISTFERYYNTLSMLNEKQQKFFIDLSYNFIHIEQINYIDYLVDLLNKIRADFPNDNLIFVCCLPKEDSGKTKSSASVLYLIRGTSIKKKIKLDPFYAPDNVNEELFNNIKNDNFRIVLVDDFVGTGDTAMGAIDFIHELFPSLGGKNDHLLLLCIVAMEVGIKKLSGKGVKVYNSITAKKGISDYYSNEKEKLEAISCMCEIEKKIKKLNPIFHFGYNQSEALVCMERCPNNTFPIYWKMKNIAPYER